MTDFDAVAERYLQTWNETDRVGRRALLERWWATGARYVDPLADVAGLDAIDALIAGAQEQFPGWRFRPLGRVDAHHDQARFGWELGPDGAEAPIAGFDVVQCDGAGRLALVLGFLDRVPAS